MTWGPLTQKALDRPNTAPTGSFVYFVLDPEHGQVKIGVARNVKSRIAALQSGSVTPLEFAGALAGSFELEKELHETFEAQRVRGEWFRIDERLIELVEAAKAAGTRRDKPCDGFSDEMTERVTVKLPAAAARELAELMGLTENQAKREIRSMPQYHGYRVRFVEEEAAA